jgi:hypothetical protein
MSAFKIFSRFVFVTLIISCGENSYEKYKKRQAKEKNRFEESISEKQKHLIHQFFTGEIKREDGFTKIDGGLYCLWKQREVDIYPHLALNEKLKSNDYNITCNKDSMEYIVVSESISHKVGTYTNGGDATQMEVVVSVIDLKNSTAYTLTREMGSSPPATVRRRRGSNSGAIGSFFGDDEIYKYLTSQVIDK